MRKLAAQIFCLAKTFFNPDVNEINNALVIIRDYWRIVITVTIVKFISIRAVIWVKICHLLFLHYLFDGLYIAHNKNYCQQHLTKKHVDLQKSRDYRKHMETLTHLERAIELVGGQAALGRATGKSQQYIWNLVHKAKKIKAEFAIEVEKATNGQVTRAQLRPDIFEDAA